jgi:hypothetical protein
MKGREKLRRMRRKVNGFSIVVIMIALILFFSSMGRMQSAQAQTSDTIVSISPGVSVATSGDYFNVSVMVVNVTGLWLFQTYVNYSPDILEIPRNASVPEETSPYAYWVYEGNFLKRGAYTTFWVPQLNNTRGELRVWNSMLAPGPEASGSGELFTVTFRVKSSGMCCLDVCNVALATRNQTAIPHNTTDGVFTTFSNATTKSVSWQSFNWSLIAESNSTLSESDFDQPNKALNFNVTGADGTSGFTTLAIPIGLLRASLGDWTVLVDDSQVMPLTGANATHSFVFVNYTHSTHQIRIMGTEAVPEPTRLAILMPLLLIIAFVIIAAKRRTFALARGCERRDCKGDYV